jgi:hypothetical protein
MNYNIPPNTLKPYPEGASSIREAGITNTNAAVNKQMSLMATGGKRNKKGGQNSVTLSPLSVPYNDPGAGNNTVTANYSNGIQTILQSNSNSIYDSCVGQGPSCTLAQNAGSKRRRHTNKRRRTNKRRHTNKRRRTNKRRHTNKRRRTKH